MIGLIGRNNLASACNPSDFKNREEDAPSIGVPVNDKATIQEETDSTTTQKPQLKELPKRKVQDSTTTTNEG